LFDGALFQLGFWNYDADLLVSHHGQAGQYIAQVSPEVELADAAYW
jgi:hypothetical protein